MATALDSILQTIQRERGGVASIHSSFSEFPEGIEAHYQMYRALVLQDGLPLPRHEIELLATATSEANVCPYCITHHSEALKNLNATIPPAREALLRKLALILTTNPWKSSLLQDEFLSGGFTKAEWQHAVMVVSYFNFANRCVHALGLQVETNFAETCR
jgi:AhpD family alkylhydroperoxidase